MMTNEILEKLAKRTISYFQDDIAMQIDTNYEIVEVDKIDYFDITTLISLSLDMSGTVGMSVTNELAYEMVKNFIFGEVSQEEIEEMSAENISETLNITLGNIISELSVIQKGGKVNISTPYTMHNSVTITKKKNGKMYLCKIKSGDDTVLLSYFV